LPPACPKGTDIDNADPIEELVARSLAVRRRLNDPRLTYSDTQRIRADRNLTHAWDCRRYARAARRRGDEAETAHQIHMAGLYITQAEKEAPDADQD
jgi:hypothetical protein